MSKVSRRERRRCKNCDNRLLPFEKMYGKCSECGCIDP